MRCDCCGKRKCWLESFEDINAGNKVLHLCVKCSTLVYKIRDVEKSTQDLKKSLIAELVSRMSENSSDFKKWLDDKVLKVQ